MTYTFEVFDRVKILRNAYVVFVKSKGFEAWTDALTVRKRGRQVLKNEDNRKSKISKN